MAEGKRVLPPPPFPGRGLPPPRAHRTASGTFTLESDTPTRTVDTAQLGAMVSLLEVLTPKQRDRLAAIGDLMRDLSDEQLERLLDFAVELNGLA